MARDQRRLAAIVSADVAEYSRLMGQDESGTLAALKAHLRELIDPKVAEHGGRIVKTSGDGLLLEFPSVVDAVRCAVEVQRGMAERNAGVPTDQRIDFRIGINVGDIIIDGDDIFGDGVNVAARLQTLAVPGTICVGRAVRDQVLDKLNFAFEDLGLQTVKNIARPIEVFRIRDDATEGTVVHSQSASSPEPRGGRRIKGAGWHWWGAAALAMGVAGIVVWQLTQFLRPGQAPAPPAFSVAVIPFSFHGGGPADEQLADALALDVSTKLGQWKKATVASERKVSSYKGKGIDSRVMARELDVRYLVDGELRRVGSQLAITVRLIDAESESSVWSDRLEFDAVRPADEQSVPATRLANRLSDAIYQAELKRASTRPVPGSAVDLALRGDAAWAVSMNDREKLLAARKFYDDALRIDPNLLLALGSLSNVLDQLLTEDLEADRSVFAQRIEELDRTTAHAIIVGSDDSGVWYYRANALVWLGRWEEALAANAKSQALRGTVSTLLSQRAYIMLGAGRFEEALTVAERASALESRSIGGEEGYAVRMVCASKLVLGRYGDAVRACERSAARDNWWLDQASLAAGYAQLGESDKAALAKAALLKLKPGFTIDKLRASDPLMRNPAYLQRAEPTLYAGLRKAGIPDR